MTPNKMKGTLNTSQNNIDSSKGFSNFVDVLVGGYRMRYPSSFVLICSDDIDVSLFDSVNTNHSPKKRKDFEMKKSSEEFKIFPKEIIKNHVALQRIKNFGLCKENQTSFKKVNRFTIIDGPYVYSLFRKNYFLSKFQVAPQENRRCYLSDLYAKRSLLSSSIYDSEDKKWIFSSPSCQTNCTCSEEPLSCPFITMKKSNKRTSYYHNRMGMNKLSGDDLAMLFSKIDKSTGFAYAHQISKDYHHESSSQIPHEITTSVVHSGKDPVMPTLSPQQPTHLKDKLANISRSPSIQPPSPKKIKVSKEIKKESDCEENTGLVRNKLLGVTRRLEENKTVTGLVVNNFKIKEVSTTPVLAQRDDIYTKPVWLLDEYESYKNKKIFDTQQKNTLWNLQPSVLDYYELQEYNENIYDEKPVIKSEPIEPSQESKNINDQNRDYKPTIDVEDAKLGRFFDEPMEYDWKFMEPHIIFKGIKGRMGSSNYELLSETHTKVLSSFIYDHRLITNDRYSLIPSFNKPNIFLKNSQGKKNSDIQNDVIIPKKENTQKKESDVENDFIVISRGNEFSNHFSSEYVQKIIQKIELQSLENAKLIKNIETIISEVCPNFLDNDSINAILPANGLLFNIFLQDSHIDLFPDHNFDSCNICECTGSVWSNREIGIYLPEPNKEILNNWIMLAQKTQDSQHNDNLDPVDRALGVCKCGFSTSMNRKAVSSANLFFEDEIEVMSTNLIDAVRSDPEILPLINASAINRLIVSQPKNLQENSEDNLKWLHSTIHPYINIPLYINYAENTIKDLDDALISCQAHFAKIDFLKTIFHHIRNSSFLDSYPYGNIFSDFIVSNWTFSKYGFTKVVKENILEFKETSALFIAALKQSGPAYFDDDIKMNNVKSPSLSNRPKDTIMCDDISLKNGIFVHPGFVMKRFSKPISSFSDQILLLETLKPILQEAISSTRQLEASYTVDGPLTWKEFHQLAGRGNEESSKPQPIPQFRVEVKSSFSGGTANPLSMKNFQTALVSPFALSSWSNLNLCPVSKKKRISYLVLYPVETEDGANAVSLPKKADFIGPDIKSSQEYVMKRVSRFFYGLKTAYESCKLGNHQPLPNSSVNKGCIPVSCLTNQRTNMFMSSLPENNISMNSALRELEGNMDLNSFTQFVRVFLSNATMQCIDSLVAAGILSESDVLKQNKSDLQGFPTSFKSSSNSPANGIGSLSTSVDLSTWGTDKDVYLMVYLVEPFTMMFDCTPKFMKIMISHLINGFMNTITSYLSATWMYRINFQVVSLGSILEPSSIVHLKDRFQSLAISIYNQIDRFIRPSLVNSNRTLTGFGPAIEKENLSSQREPHHIRRIFAPAYQLHQNLYHSGQLDNIITGFQPKLLFISYCLSSDQKFLLVTCVDFTGSLLKETVIDISLPSAFSKFFYNSYQQSAKSIIDFSLRKWALSRIWDFIISVIGATSSPWRLIIGRLGRMGHGELKGWNDLLSKRNLQKFNENFRKICSLCSVVGNYSDNINNSVENERFSFFQPYPSNNEKSKQMNSCTHELPMIVSSCLVSLEAGSNFKIYSNRSGLLLNGHTKRGFKSSSNLSQGFGPSMTACPIGASTGSYFSGNYNSNTASSQNSSANSVGLSLPTPLNLQSLSSNLPLGEGQTSIASTTHILVFPTSTSAAAQTLNEDIANLDMDIGDIDDFSIINDSFNSTVNPQPNNMGLRNDPSMKVSNQLSNKGFKAPYQDQFLYEKSNKGFSNADSAIGFTYGKGILTKDELQNLSSRCLSDETLARIIDKFDMITSKTENPEILLSEFLNQISVRIFGGKWSILEGVEEPKSSESNLLQQPIAMGYYVSNASSAQLPDWFWGESQASISNDFTCPTCLKSSLHLKITLAVIPDEHTASNEGNLFGKETKELKNQVHPLDSSSTCDVLRFILESYNTLSWLTYDPIINDRASCLPIHIFHLARIYKVIDDFP